MNGVKIDALQAQKKELEFAESMHLLENKFIQNQQNSILKIAVHAEKTVTRQERFLRGAEKLKLFTENGLKQNFLHLRNFTNWKTAVLKNNLSTLKHAQRAKQVQSINHLSRYNSKVKQFGEKLSSIIAKNHQKQQLRAIYELQQLMVEEFYEDKLSEVQYQLLSFRLEQALNKTV